MEEILNKLKNVTSDPYAKLADWKKQENKKVIGCFPMHLPEEIIHAAGILPITLLGNDEPITLADKYLQPSLCHLGRTNFDLALKGKLDFLDGIVFPDICDLIQIMPDIWNFYKPLPFQHTVVIAGKFASPSSRSYIIEEFKSLKLSLERFIGREISNEDLQRSIAIYNQDRDLLYQLYKIRQDNPSIIKASEIASIVMASMLMLKEEHAALLSHILEQIEIKKPSDKKVRLLISGNLCTHPEYEITDMVEAMGAVVVEDDLYVGKRYFATKVNENTDPIEALAEHYIEDIPCPTKHNLDRKYADYLSSLAKEAKADGVIILILKYCEPHSFTYPILKAKFSQDNIPHLLIETELFTPIEQLRTRIQAFIETLEGK